jgi:hypothetical protein
MSCTEQLFEIVGNLYGATVGYPSKPSALLPDIDARTHALRALKAFIATQMFQRTGDKCGDPIPFQVKPENIHVEQPDDVKRLRFPAIAFIPSRANYQPFGLGPGHLNDDTFDVYAPGTVLLNQAEWNEIVGIEIWGSKRAERRALKAGLEAVLMGSESSFALTLKMPRYFDRDATFALVQGEVIDDLDVVRNRRRADLYVELQTQIVSLVNAVTLKPMTRLAEIGTEVEC